MRSIRKIVFEDIMHKIKRDIGIEPGTPNNPFLLILN